MPTADAKFSFPQSCRLKSSLLIKDVVQQRQSVFSFPVKCFYSVVPSSETDLPKVAFLVSKKRFHHAVDRNRVKRLLRESYRHHFRALPLPEGQSLLLCMMFVSSELPSLQQVDASISQIFSELQSRITMP
jgi:ribonuclease P protein component